MTEQLSRSWWRVAGGWSGEADGERPGRSALVWVLPGLSGGVAFLAVVVCGGALVGRPWALPDAIAAVLGVHTRGYPARLVPALTGVGTHLAVSVILGVLYLACAQRLQLRGWWLVLGGWLFSGLETPISLWGILHIVLPRTTFHYFLDAVPFWVSFLGHTVYGLALGGVSAQLRRGLPPSQRH